MKVNILIRSMGPISEMKMVMFLNRFNFEIVEIMNNFSITPWTATSVSTGATRDSVSKA